MRLRRTAVLLVPVLGAAFAACVDDSTSPGQSPDASTPQTFDGSVDATGGQDTGPVDDASGDVATDAGARDAADGSAPGDAAVDATDAADAADAAPRFDDAGCPLPTGVVANAGDAGLPATGIALWLRADLGLATLDGGAVCRWDDVSGNARNFAPATSAMPAFDSAGIKGKPAVSFGASGQHLIRNDVLGIAATAGRTMAAYSRSVDTTRRFQAIHQGLPGSAGTYFGIDTNTFQTAGSLEGVYTTNNAFDSNVATSTNARSHIFSISSFAVGGTLPGVLTYAVDGNVTTLTRILAGLGNGTVEDFSAANLTTIGGAVPGFTGAEVAEILVWDHALTAPERAAVQAYFQSRFP